jgi:hypothetical protein
VTRDEAVTLAVRRHMRQHPHDDMLWIIGEMTAKAIRSHFRTICRTYQVQ